MNAQATQQNDTHQRVQERTDVATEIKMSHDVKTSNQSKTNRTTTAELASDEQEQTVEREYDTSQPVNPITGTPPLKRETTKNRTKTETGKQHDNTQQDIDHARHSAKKEEAKSDITNAVDSNDIDQTKISTQVDTIEKRGDSLWIILSIIGLIVAICYAIRLIKK